MAMTPRGAAFKVEQAASASQQPGQAHGAVRQGPWPTDGGGASLIRIEGELRRCATREALWHHLVNEPSVLLPAGQALVFEAPPMADAAWRAVAGAGLVSINRDAPMVRWYENIVARLRKGDPQASTSLRLFDLPEHAAPEDPCTAEAAMRHMMWVPLIDGACAPRAGWLLARDTPWEEAHERLAERLGAAYAHGLSAIEGRARPPAPWSRHRRRLGIGALGLVALAAIVRVPLTTLAPVEVTPQDPFVVASPVPGVVERLLVAPGAQVEAHTPLVQLVDTTLRSDFDVADQKVEVARAKMLRLQQASVDDPSAKRELAIAQTEEKVAVAERDYAAAMLDKTIIRARQPGVALYGDPRDWIGRPVAVGEAIMRVADPKRVEYQVKMAVADAVNLVDNARVRIFLDASPLEPIEAHVVRSAYKAEADAAGVASFTVTARAEAPPERLGLRGTARVYGERVSLLYYLLRRPITAARQWTGI
ncbi:MAG: HlyD family efflux transporter periplasmic adaptor subunit [Proteobacteria bacterium]|nr:HlyD family efflux transporter periplasmic adaptor subunit [Pseudomonadota bacterium]